jgi:hypothetical protein
MILAGSSCSKERISSYPFGMDSLWSCALSVAFIEETDHFLWRHSQTGIDLQGSDQKVSSCPWNAYWNEGLDWDSLNLAFEFSLSFSPPRSIASEHLVEDDADRPDITFGTIDVIV